VLKNLGMDLSQFRRLVYVWGIFGYPAVASSYTAIGILAFNGKNEVALPVVMFDDWKVIIHIVLSGRSR